MVDRHARRYRAGDMSERELVILGTASQVPTRTRNHNGYLLRWDGEGWLFDPGEGTQRQLTLAGVSAASIDRICITHLHGDHCFGLPGVLQRMELDQVMRTVELWCPSSGAVYVERLRGAVIGRPTMPLQIHPSEAGLLAETERFRLIARRLDHRVDALGYRIEEPDGRRMVPERLREHGIEGADIGRLQDAGRIELRDRVIDLDEVSEPRPGQVFSFVMDTRMCDGAFELAEGADLLVCESTYLEEHAGLAERYGHLTAAQAATIARDAKARRLVLTHFSQRYDDLPRRVLAEASAVYDGEIVVAEDLSSVLLPPRR